MTALTPAAHILVVDDEAMPRMTVTRALNLMGYRAEEAASGAQALERMAEATYDLMLLDLRMPGMDGLEVMRHARQISPDTLIIILTAHATLDSAIAAVRFGANDYLLKPCSLRETEAAICRVLDQRDRAAADAAAAAPERVIRSGPLALDIETRTARVAAADGAAPREIELTGNEAALLANLMQSPDRVFSCRDLARAALGYLVSDREAEDIIRPHMSRLRNKIEIDPAHPTLIRTIRGKGYSFSAI